jgi:hypothetical protein
MSREVLSRVSTPLALAFSEQFVADKDKIFVNVKGFYFVLAAVEKLRQPKHYKAKRQLHLELVSSCFLDMHG